MNSIAIGWKKQSSNEVQILPHRQCFQKDLTSKIDNQGKKSAIKKVHFNFRTSTAKQQNHSETIRSFEDHDYISSSSTNIFTTRLPTVYTEPICSIRAIIITFVIIVLIIIATAIAIGAVFGSIKSSQNTIGTLTGNINLNLPSTGSPTRMTSSVSIGSQSGAPCSSYTTIDDPSRNVSQIGVYGTCDNGPIFNTSNGGAWIRFVGSGGTIISLSPIGTNHCGGFIPGWLNNTLPTILGTMINGTICFSNDADPCFRTYETEVIYCIGSFYIYFLSPVSVCNARYCTT